MKIKNSVRGVLLLFATVFLALAVWAGMTPPVSVSAAGGEDFEITQYAVKMSVSDKRKIDVKEQIAVRFFRTRNGIIRDFPLEKGVRYSGLKASRDGKAVDLSLNRETIGGNPYLSYYIGGQNENLSAGTTYVYRIDYTMVVPVPEDKQYLSLDVIGFGWGVEISNVTVNLDLPDAPLDYQVFTQLGSAVNQYASVALQGSAAVITADYLPLGSGITFDLQFKEGVLGYTPDLTPLWASLLGMGVLAVTVLVKLFLRRQPLMVRTVNLTAPDEMDPLVMGKLFDGKVDKEDLGALIFYFADKGYLTIDMSQNRNDPLLIKSQTPLPEDSPAHRRIMYDGLFSGGKQVHISDLKDRFYRTAESVKTVTGNGENYYEKHSAAFSVLFALLSVLSFGIFAFLLGRALAACYDYFACFFAALFAYAVPCFCAQIVAMRTFKWKKAAKFFTLLGGFTGGVLIGLLISVIFSSLALTLWTAVAISAFSASCGIVGGFMLLRTKQYSEKLGHILGFRDFLLYTEKDKIKFMLEEDPELYYKVLPYAQVLGVTDEWTDRFKGLDMRAPSYMRTSAIDTAVDIAVYSALFRSLNRSFTQAAFSRPNSGSSGGHYGGRFGGGFGGGGGHFGGGGGGGGFGGGGGRSF